MATRPPKPVETYRHKSEKRSNLPTEQTSIYMGKEDRKGILYKPELHSREGPLLSWDRDVDLENVETEATPLYIHEKIHPATFAKSLESKISGGGSKAPYLLTSIISRKMPATNGTSMLVTGRIVLFEERLAMF